MDKFKGMLQISDRDKRLLLVVAAFAIVALAYFFGYQKLTTLGDDLSDNKVKLEKQEKDLTEKNKNKEKYIRDERVYSSLYRDIIADYDNGLTQPSEIDFFNKIELVTGAWIKSISFSTPTVIHTFGRIAPSNPNATTLSYTTDMVGYETVLSISYEASYANWKKMIEYINTYYAKSTINNISSSYSEANDVVSGTIEISMYAITGSERRFSEPQFDATVGASNIFSSLQRKAAN